MQTAARPPAPAPAAGAPPPVAAQGPSMMGTFGSSMAGSMAGSMIGNSLFGSGGGGAAPQAAPDAAAPAATYGAAPAPMQEMCQFESTQFLSCMAQTGDNLDFCRGVFDSFKLCKQAAMAGQPQV